MSFESNNMNNDTSSVYEDQNMNTSTSWVTPRSRARTQAIERHEERLRNNNHSLPVSPLSEPIPNGDLEPPGWLAANFAINHPDWTSEDVAYNLDRLWTELSTEEQIEFICQGPQVIFNEYYQEEEEVLDSGVLDEDNLYPYPTFVFNSVINNYSSLPPPPPPPKIVPDSHPSGDDEEGIDGLTCVVCMENKVKVFPRCGHLCCCIGCSKAICLDNGRCPICREYWCDLRMVYFP